MCGGEFKHATVKDVEQISYAVSFFKFYCFDTLIHRLAPQIRAPLYRLVCSYLPFKKSRVAIIRIVYNG